jgi:ABC-type transport system substrate-binding protein
VPIEDVDRIAKHPRVRIQKVVGFRMYFLGMNVQMKPFDNKLLRQAINYALDPRVMLKHIYEGHGAVVNGPLGSNWVGFDPKIKRYPYDPKKARELLTQAGYPNGLEIKLYLAPDRHLKGKEVCEVIADQLGKVGIKVELVPQEYAIYWGKDGVNGGKLPFYYAGSNGSDADVYFEQYFRTGGSKRINYNNPEFDKLIDEEQRTGDQKKRVAILHQAGRILMEDVPFAPLYTLAELYGVTRNVLWKGSPDGKILAADMKIKG